MKKIFYLLSIVFLLSTNLFAQQGVTAIQGYWKNRIVPPVAQVNETFSSYWNLLGNAVTTNTATIGTTTNRSIYFKTNNVQIAKADSGGFWTFGLSPVYNPTTLGFIRFYQGTVGMDFGNRTTGSPAIWFGQTTNTTLNWGISGNINGTQLNGVGTTGAADIDFRMNGVNALIAKGTFTSGAVIQWDFVGAALTGQTAGTAIPYMRLTPGSIQYSVSAPSTNTTYPFRARTISSTSATTQGTDFCAYFSKSIAGSQYTITNGYGIGTDGMSRLEGKVVIGSTTVPTEMLDLYGNLSLAAAGNKIIVKGGSNAAVGTVTLAAGTVAVTNTIITANSQVILTPRDITNAGHLGVTYAAATGFTISSSSGTDARVIDYYIIERQ